MFIFISKQFILKQIHRIRKKVGEKTNVYLVTSKQRQWLHFKTVYTGYVFIFLQYTRQQLTRKKHNNQT